MVRTLTFYVRQIYSILAELFCMMKFRETWKKTPENNSRIGQVKSSQVKKYWYGPQPPARSVGERERNLVAILQQYAIHT